MRPVNLWQRAADGSIDANATLKVASIYLTIALFLFCGIGALVSLVYSWTHPGATLNPSAGWIDVLQSLLLFLAAVFGIAGGVTWAKWREAPKQAQADVIKEAASVTAEQRAAAKVALPPPSEPIQDLGEQGDDNPPAGRPK